MLRVLTPLDAAADSNMPRIVFLLNDPSPPTGVLHAFDSIVRQLGELDLEVRVIHGPRPASIRAQAQQARREATLQHARAAFWFTTESGGSIRVYALHSESGQVYSRSVELEGNTPVQREWLSVVLRASILAVLEDEEALGEPLFVAEPHDSESDASNTTEAPSISVPDATTPERSANEASPSPTRAVPSPLVPPPLRVGIAYSGSTLGGTSHWQNGMLGEVVWNLTPLLRTSLAAGYVFPTEVAGNGASAVVSRFPITARLGAGFPAGPVSLGLEGGVLFEAWHRTTRVQSDALQPTDPTTVWRAGGLIALRVEVPVSSAFGLYLVTEGQVFPFQHRLSIRRAEAEQPLAISSVRPHWILGVFSGLPSAHSAQPH